MSEPVSSPDGPVPEVKVKRRWRNEQQSPPNAAVAQVRTKAEQPRADGKAHAGNRLPVALSVCIQALHISRQV
jgi:hypothetical protein